MRLNDKITGHSAIFFATLFLGLNVPILKLLMPAVVGGVEMSMLRIVGAALLMWAISLFSRHERIEGRDWMPMIWGGLFGLFAFMLMFNLGVQYGSPVNSAVMLTLAPILVMVITSWLDREPLSRIKIVGSAISLVGALSLILLSGGFSLSLKSLRGDIFAFLSTLCYAFYLIIVRGPSSRYRPEMFLRWVLLIASVPALLIYVLGFDKLTPLHQHSASDIAMMLYVVLFPTFLTYLLIPVAIRRIGQVTVSLYIYFIPVIATISSLLFHVEKLAWWQPICMVVVLLGVYLSSKERAK